MISRNNSINLSIVAVVALILSACSFKTLYNQLDIIIPAYVDDMVTLDGVFEEKVDNSTISLLSWHRSTQLERYADQIEAMQEDVRRGITLEDVGKHAKSIDDFWKDLNTKINEEIAEVLPLIDDDQLEELTTSLNFNNEDFREDHVDVDLSERREVYTERLMDTFEEALGELTDRQIEKIRATAGLIESTAKWRLKRRQLWSNEVTRILSTEEPPMIKKESLRDLFSEIEFTEDDQVKKIRVKNTELISKLIVDVSKTLTDEQRQFFITRSNEYIKMLNELSEGL